MVAEVVAEVVAVVVGVVVAGAGVVAVMARVVAWKAGEVDIAVWYCTPEKHKHRPLKTKVTTLNHDNNLLHIALIDT